MNGWLRWALTASLFAVQIIFPLRSKAVVNNKKAPAVGRGFGIGETGAYQFSARISKCAWG